jgi:multidrug efflux system membrane fusion protein
MRTHPRKLLVLVVGVLSLVLAGCSSEKSPAGTPAQQGRGAGGGGRGGGRGAGGPVPVTTTRVAAKAVPLTIPAVGTAEALQTVQIRAQVTGQLSAIHFTEGQEVRK